MKRSNFALSLLILAGGVAIGFAAASGHFGYAEPGSSDRSAELSGASPAQKSPAGQFIDPLRIAQRPRIGQPSTLAETHPIRARKISLGEASRQFIQQFDQV